MTGNRRKGFIRLRKLATLREERAQRAAAAATRARLDAELAHVTQLSKYRETQPAAAPAGAFLLEREVQALHARAADHTASMLQEATAQMERSQAELRDAARDRMTYERLDARARATQAALVARASLRALDDLNGQRRTR
jgi:flagellar biosynthesis chaperone FliJ